MASANAKTPKNLKSSPAKKTATPAKKKGPASPTKEKGKEKANGEVKGKGKAVNGAVSAGSIPKTGVKDTKSPAANTIAENDPISSERFSNGVSLDNAGAGDFGADNFDQSMEGHLMIGDLRVIFLTETDTKYINSKQDSVAYRPGDAASDVTLELDHKTFRCHKRVLIPASDYFKELLSSGKDTVTIDKDIGADIFEIILESLYDGYVLLNREISMGFFDAAASLQIHWLTDAGADNMMRAIGPDNYLVIGRLFQKYNLDSLKQETYNLVAHNLVVFSDSNEFMETLEYDTLYNILSKNLYVEGSEGFIVKVILDWVHMNKESRQQYLGDLAKLIRFPLLEVEELERLPRDITSIPQVARQIEEAKKYALNITAQSLYSGEQYCGRGFRNTVALVSASEMNNGNLILYKDFNSLQEPMCVEQLEPAGLKTELTFTAQASLGNFLYVAGGYNEQYCSSPRVFRFDPRFREWIELSPMNQDRVSFSMCSSDKNVFAVGGIARIVEEEKEEEKSLDTAEMYSPAENTWKDLPALPYGCSDHALTYCDGKVYISGGISSNPMDPIPLDYMHALQVQGGTSWESLTPMLTGRQGHSMSTVNGKIYVMGGKSSGGIGIEGFGNCLSTEMYNTSSKQWTKVAALPETIGTVSRFVAVLGEKIVFLAGQHWHYYDTEQDTFSEGDFCGPEVQRVVALQVAYPRTA